MTKVLDLAQGRLQYVFGSRKRELRQLFCKHSRVYGKKYFFSLGHSKVQQVKTCRHIPGETTRWGNPLGRPSEAWARVQDR